MIHFNSCLYYGMCITESTSSFFCFFVHTDFVISYLQFCFCSAGSPIGVLMETKNDVEYFFDIESLYEYIFGIRLGSPNRSSNKKR